jgi:hypothetical protein
MPETVEEDELNPFGLTLTPRDDLQTSYELAGSWSALSGSSAPSGVAASRGGDPLVLRGPPPLKRLLLPLLRWRP